MNSKKWLIMFILAALILTNAGVVTARAEETYPTPIPYLYLKYEISPLTVYPPIVIFTATLYPFQPTNDIDGLVVSFYQVQPALDCIINAKDGGCSSNPKLIGMALLDTKGKAVFSKPFYPGKYSVAAQVTVNKVSIWSNPVNFIVSP